MVAVAGAMAFGVGTLVALPSNLQASAANTIGVIGHVPSTPLYDVGVKTSVGTPAATSTTSSSSSPNHFTAQVVDGRSTFTYTMAGKDPSKTQANGLTTVKAFLEPVIIKFETGIPGIQRLPTVVTVLPARWSTDRIHRSLSANPGPGGVSPLGPARSLMPFSVPSSGSTPSPEGSTRPTVSISP